MIDVAVQQKQHKSHKEPKPHAVEGEKTIESLNGQMDELKAAVAVAKDAVKSVPNHHIKSKGHAEEQVSASHDSASRPKQSFPKKEQVVWADKMRESAEDLKIVQAPLSN